jgi:hypothetical protein
MRGAKPCPHCGFLLRYEDPPDPAFRALAYVAVELLPWAALALFITCLSVPPDTSALYGALAGAALAAWIWLRPRQRAQAAALLARRRYHCARCKRRFHGEDLREAPPWPADG